MWIHNQAHTKQPINGIKCSTKYSSPTAIKGTMWIRMHAKVPVISPVEEPTPWCAEMVMVPKESGICVDLKLINENVLWEVHPMLKMDTILVYNYLEQQCSESWMPIVQIPLAKEFNFIPLGCFNKVHFGIYKGLQMPCIFRSQRGLLPCQQSFWCMERTWLNTNPNYRQHWREFS